MGGSVEAIRRLVWKNHEVHRFRSSCTASRLAFGLTLATERTARRPLSMAMVGENGREVERRGGQGREWAVTMTVVEMLNRPPPSVMELDCGKGSGRRDQILP